MASITQRAALDSRNVEIYKIAAIHRRPEVFNAEATMIWAIGHDRGVESIHAKE
jgi:hypothetical protein